MSPFLQTALAEQRALVISGQHIRKVTAPGVHGGYERWMKLHAKGSERYREDGKNYLIFKSTADAVYYKSRWF